MRKAISKYLKEVLDLELKSNWQVFKFNYRDEDGVDHGRFLDFMGLRFYRDRTTIRKRIMLKSTRKAAKIDRKQKQGKDITWYDSAQMLSFLSWYYYTDCYDIYLKWI